MIHNRDIFSSPFNPEEPVDAVITWVDGYDKAHAEKLASYFSKQGIKRPIIAAAATRFNQCGEIDYCVNSLLCFAPWIRTIYIVTDSQTPPIIHHLRDTPNASKLKLVDHHDIFQGFENCLPTFNSLAIESVLWRIKGLSNHFIYLNDDFFLIRPVTYKDFFQNKKVVLRGKWKTASKNKWLRRLFSKTSYEDGHRALQEKSACLAGFDKQFFHLPHAPLALRKSTLESFFHKNPELLSKNTAFAIRNPEQFWPMSLAQHLEIKNNTALFDTELQTVYIEGDTHSRNKIRSRLHQAEKNKQAAFLCMQSMDVAPEPTRKLMLHWLHNRIFQGSSL